MFILFKPLKSESLNQKADLPSISADQILLLIISALTVFTAPFFYTDFSNKDLYSMSDHREFDPGVLLNMLFNTTQILIIILLFIELLSFKNIRLRRRNSSILSPACFAFTIALLGYLFYCVIIYSSIQESKKGLDPYFYYSSMYELQLILGLLISGFLISFFFFITNIVRAMDLNFIFLFLTSLILTGAYFFGIFHLVTKKHNHNLSR